MADAAKDKANYDKKRLRAAEESRRMTEKGQDIGSIPLVKNRRRRSACKNSLAKFCKTYFPYIFNKPWSEDHRDVIKGIENAVFHGELQAIAMPRGSGKTAILTTAVVWAAIYGHRRFISLIAVSADAAEVILNDIKTWFETNPLLFEDFPEVCYPIRKLERIVSRQRGQKCCGVHTRIQWTARKIVLPSVEGSLASGCVISCAGMTGGDIRGQHHSRPDGAFVRPDLVLIDDPQTRESAKSATQVARNVSLLKSDILGMAGPGKTIAGLLACTVICQDDMADQILNRKSNPEWRGKRTKLLSRFPVNMDLWEDYKAIRHESMDNDRNGEEATEFYRKNRRAMDEGAEATWKERFDPKKELSALQAAMNLYFMDRRAFFSEYQNEPLVEETSNGAATVDVILSKCNKLPRRQLDFDTQKITMFVDVHDKLLYWMVCGWRGDFTGNVLDYGTYPHVGATSFKMRDIRGNLCDLTRIPELEGAVRYALDDLILSKLEEEFVLNGWPHRINRILVDGNYSQLRDVVYGFCQASQMPSVNPSHGVGITATQKTFAERTYSKGDVMGTHWKMPAPRKGRPCWHVEFDTNFWKTFIHNRLKTAVGSPGSLTLFGDDPLRHLLLASHLTSESVQTVTADNGRRADVWTLAPDTDNHWFDCAVGCAVAASIEGIELPSLAVPEETHIDISKEWVHDE